MTERPELRTFKSDPVREIMADRGKYIAACLTILRAYILAGKPGKLTPLASFNEWSDLVRSSLVWLGCADPLETMEAARADDVTVIKLKALVGTWSQTVSPGEAKSCSELITIATSTTHNEAFLEALKGVGSAKNGQLDAGTLGLYLKRNKDKIVDDWKIISEIDTNTKTNKWSLLNTDLLKGN